MSQHRIAIFALIVVASSRGALAQGPGATPVVVCPVVERELPVTMKLVGTILPEKKAVVASEVGGMVKELLADEGAFLRAGDVLARIDSAVARYRLTESEGRLESLREKLKELRNGTRPEEVRRMKASLQEAQAWYDRWEFEYKRVEDLFKREMGNPTEQHNTSMEYTAATRRLEQAKASLELAENGPRAEEIARAQADVTAQEAVVARFARDVNKTTITAPFDGFVVRKRTEIGEWVEEGGPIVEIVGMENVRVRVDAPEQATPFALPGAPVSVEVEALRVRFSAKIARVIPEANPTSRTFPIDIVLPNKDHALLPGMFVWAHVPSGANGRRLVVSRDALVTTSTGTQVFVVRGGNDGNHMAMPVSVTTGIEVGSEIEIVGPGIAAGDQAVCRANERLFGPTSVIPTPMDTKPAERSEATATGSP